MSQSESQFDIAVVGMSGRFPGAATIRQFWENLRDGRETLTDFTDEQLLAAGVPESVLNDPNYVKRGAVLEDMEGFDAGFFGFNPNDAAVLDPQHRHFLECAWEAMEDAGHPPDRFKGPVAVYAGVGMGSYMSFNLLNNRELMDSMGLFLVRHTGNDKDFLATRVSYEFNLTGPSVNVQTACSTSLVAIHLAYQALLNGEADMALAGGVTIELPHRQGYLYKEGEILSPDGRCRAFDADSQGTVFGSGAGVVVLRRLEDALADGDHIHAIIKGSAINNDGSAKVGYLAPSVDGQAKAISEAIAVADIDPETISYIETHGTGTNVGDPIEIAALTQAFRASTEKSGYCGVGSIKPNIGHLDTAAGVASFIKTVEALKHRQIPPSIWFDSPNPECDFDNSPFYVVSELADWNPGYGDADSPRRAGVSSLGVGGTNAHVIVEEAPLVASDISKQARQLLLLSAKTPDALKEAAINLAEHIESESEINLADVAWTLQVGRTRMTQATAVVCESRKDAIAALKDTDNLELISGVETGGRSIAFMFAGGGAQYAGMGRELYESEPVFRAAVDECLSLLEPEIDFDLKALLFPAPDAMDAAAAELERPTRTLPALFTIQYAQACQWMAWGVQPGALVGHSMGEYTAACLSGVLNLKDALALVAFRGRLFEKLPAGTMLSVPLSATELQPLLGDELSLSAANAPELSVAGGPVAAIEALEQRLAERDIESTRIHISVAAHSLMLEPFLAEFRDYVAGFMLGKPEIPFISNLTGDWVKPDEVSKPEYWVRHLRETVRFSDGLVKLLEDPSRVLLEVGPGRTLATLAKSHDDQAADRAKLTSLPHPEDRDTSDAAFMLKALGELWAAGVEIDWQSFYADEQRCRLSLPTYPFEHRRYWIEPTQTAAAADTTAAAPEDWFYTPVWRPSPLPATDPDALARSRLLVLTAGGPLDDAFLAEARGRARVVVTAEAGADFAELGDDKYRIDLQSRDDFDRLFADLDKQRVLPDVIISLLDVDAAADNCGIADAYLSAVDKSFVSLLHLAQALADVDISDAVSIISISDGMQHIAGQGAHAPLKALALGPVSVIPREFPDLKARSIDVSLSAKANGSQQNLVSALLNEIAGAADDVIAYRGNNRLVRAFDPLSLGAPGQNDISIREGGTYLITGGLGGIALEVAGHLAGRYPLNLVLTGRSELPEASEWNGWLADHAENDLTSRKIARLQALEEAGAAVSYISADIADKDQVNALVQKVQQQFGPINGVFHTAGVLDDAPVLLKMVAEAEAVLRAKVLGSMVLAETVPGEKLDFTILFSSVSSFAGLPGQVDYSAANAFMDAYAHCRNSNGARTVAINWPAWQEVGMAAELARMLGGEAGFPVDHPLLDRCTRQTPTEAVFSTQLDPASDWILAEHRLRDGACLIPGAGYIELARAAYEVYTGDSKPDFADVFFMAPFTVADGETGELQIRLEKSADEYEFVLFSEAGGGVAEHVRGTLKSAAARTDAPADISALKSACADRSEEFSGHDHHSYIAFGPRWGSLRQIDYGGNQALVSLEMPAEFAGELDAYGLHPALLDLSMAAAQSLITGFDPDKDFFVPIGCTSARLNAPLKSRLYSLINYKPNAEGQHDQDIALFDIDVMDESGEHMLRISDFTMKRIADRTLLASDAEAAVAAPADTDSAALELVSRSLELGIAPAQGLEALDRILACRGLPQVVVSVRPIDALLAELRSLMGVTAGSEAEEEIAHDPQLAALEQILLEHPAIAEAVATSVMDRPGERRVIAYLVYDPAEHATVTELRRFVKGKVELDFVPRAFVELDELPRKSNGDPDYTALPDPFGPGDDHIAPRTDTEKMIADIWQDVLGVKRVGVYDNFFDVGGHSLLSIRVITKVKKQTGVQLNQAIMVLQTLEQVAKECEGMLEAS
ncbi:MAG: SDR family NAD(P)-dependent oxidoreductase [Gammaproteobacteria bacterium]|nr:SDR family NAD(P)-dependent oxidoreductase [Gammaproteobacteria bacterium]MDP6617350.1 SDR family NAD(P)-dependent oxidoreductase [Gammaproteobacteria bacterium]MDP6694929.1 SDR family NAD(P)-dependent oxidoreductase [Gammaproteobacteria bacterium]